jgi:4-amino-4-deoxy-L-arabinose transferase-like glycosyltransferase
MAGRRLLLVIVALAAVLNAISIARSLLPAQDGLKFIRMARQFQTDPWPDVIRESDQHPLYPALIAAVQPMVAPFAASGPDAWRIAAQLVAAIASLAVLFPLYSITRSLFDERIACVAVAIFALLPVPAEVGHDTLSDSLGLLTILLCLRWGSIAIRTESWRLALAAGMTAGIGYLARPEVALAPLALGLAWLFIVFRKQTFRAALGSPVVPALGLSVLVMVGGYALVKGQVSEKLALRHAAALGSQPIMARPVPQWLPRGLDDARWDFSAKEETERPTIRDARKALRWIAVEWWDELCWGFAIMAIWGLARRRFIFGLCRRHPIVGNDIDDGRTERLVLAVFATIFLLALVRHGTALGYLSGRHALPLVLISVPWSAAGTFVCLRGLGVKLPWSPRVAWTAGILGMGAVVAVLVAYQLRPGHSTRWGHWAAGRWLAEHAGPADVVLDTRGWARFISGVPGYDYWHVRQALTHAQLSYVIVDHEELQASSPRAKTLKALLAYAATPVQEFPSFVGDRNVGVRIYRFQRPSSWEGMAP